jgi:hypothetical protein
MSRHDPRCPASAVRCECASLAALDGVRAFLASIAELGPAYWRRDAAIHIERLDASTAAPSGPEPQADGAGE